MKEQLADEAIVAQLKENLAPRLFAILNERYRQKIVERCRSIVKDAGVAEDLAQEVAVKVFLKLNSFEGKSKFSRWLESITENTAIDYLRRNKKKYHQTISENLAESLSDLSELEEEIPEEISMPLLEQLLAHLSPQDKLLPVLKYYEKLSIKDIGIATNLSEGAIKMRLKRARARVTDLHAEFRKGMTNSLPKKRE